ncbi:MULTISPECIES: flavin reductase family protein [unclassified Agarivorans]|uniref:flavin reductase family protein n=1 Tax=unclassified Agarivorans TaxID=2636026 RepID=UPI0026E30231|nr:MULTISPECIES: flavin reductase family protein [unclassified Agarivorans]MDO6686825.1 flavin reductase family protein [Agarivorans sp. 3_MG-2023]MDO6716444.1 flavin reductase family protein [Agarivorans sp. 2_MG-2023]MDO6765416.1 flavin reductase family protein [Agarivorans sp. 1_MG-2023]
MYIDFADLLSNQVYHCMTQTIVPRPIAWVLSDNGQPTSYNLAPFSYFTAISSDPPLIMLSVGKKPDGSDKDTKVNIQNGKYCVVHIASAEQAKQVTESAKTLPYGESEIVQQQLELASFEGFALPRLADAPIAMACELFEMQSIGNTPQSMIILKVLHLYIEEQFATMNDGRMNLDTNALNPLGRLGGGEYWANGQSFTIQRPK